MYGFVDGVPYSAPFVLTEIYCNKVNIQITQWDDFIQIVG